MNRIILIGNGFDLAHGLKTNYNDFINAFWEKEKQILLNSSGNNDEEYNFIYEDKYLLFKTNHVISTLISSIKNKDLFGYKWFEKIFFSCINHIIVIIRM